MKSNPIPADKVRWAQFDVLREHNNYLLYQELTAAAAAPKTPLQKKYGDYFAACMDDDRWPTARAPSPSSRSWPRSPRLATRSSLRRSTSRVIKRFGVGYLLACG